MNKEEWTIKEFLTLTSEIYDDVKQVIQKAFKDPLIILMDTINGKLSKILDLPLTEENWRILREFLAAY